MKSFKNDEVRKEVGNYIKAHQDEVYYYIYEILSHCPISSNKLMDLRVENCVCINPENEGNTSEKPKMFLDTEHALYRIPETIADDFTKYVQRIKRQKTQYLFCSIRGYKVDKSNFNRMLKKVSDVLAVTDLNCKTIHLCSSWDNAVWKEKTIEGVQKTATEDTVNYGANPQTRARALLVKLVAMQKMLEETIREVESLADNGASGAFQGEEE